MVVKEASCGAASATDLAVATLGSSLANFRVLHLLIGINDGEWPIGGDVPSPGLKPDIYIGEIGKYMRASLCH